MPVPPAPAGVHGAHQHKVAGVGLRRGRPDQGDLPLLHGLAQNLQHVLVKLRQLVQEQDSPVGQGNLPRLGKRGPAPCHPHRGDGVVGGPEGPAEKQGPLLGSEPHDGVNLRCLQGLPPGHGGQDRGQTPGQHTLAGAGRADHGHVVSPGGGNLQHPLYLGLPTDLRKVRQVQFLLRPRPHGGGFDGNPAGEVVGQLLYCFHRVDGEPFGQGCLRGAVRGDVQPLNPRCPGGQGHGEHPHHRPQGAGKGQLPHKGAVRVLPHQLSPRRQDAHQNGQVIQGAGFFPVGRGQVHGDTTHRELIAAVFDGGAHPLPGLLHRRVGQAHNVEVGQAPGQVALGGDLIPGDALHPQGAHLTQHRPRLLSGKPVYILLHNAINSPARQGLRQDLPPAFLYKSRRWW